MRFRIAAIAAGFLYFGLGGASIRYALATPQFARQTRLKCSSCHAHVPLLNEFGQKV